MTDLDGEAHRWTPRCGSSAVAAELNEVLLAQEIFVEKDADKFKIGDGATAYNDLPYYESAALILAAAELLFAPLNDPTHATADRPDPAVAGAGGRYFDTTLGIPGYSNGTDWVDATGATI